MFAIAAVIIFIIVAVIAFGAATSSISLIGLIAVGLACVAAHMVWPLAPWHRTG